MCDVFGMKRRSVAVNLAAIVAVTGLLAMGLAAGMIWRNEAELSCESLSANGVPVEFRRPVGDGPLPVVILAHGYAGSAKIMGPLSRTFARAGYAVASLDFAGHGRNASPFPLDLTGHESSTYEELSDELDAVVEFMRARPDVKADEIALLGHSLGAMVVMRYAMAHPEILVTVAVSPIYANVRVDSPRNLLLLVGASESRRFRDTALTALTNAGGSEVGALYGNLASGTARRLLEIPWVEHFTILFSRRTMSECLAWLDASLRPGSAPENALLDTQPYWTLLFLAGALLLFRPLARLVWRVPRVREEGILPGLGQVLGVTLAAGIVAPVLMRLIPWRFPRVLTSNYLGPFHLCYGLVAAFVLWRTGWARWGGLSEPGYWPLARYLLAVLLYVAGAWGLTLHLTSHNLLPGSKRIIPILSSILMLLPHYVAEELLVRGGQRRRTLLYWSLTRLGWLAALGLGLILSAPAALGLMLPSLVLLAFLGGYLSDALYRICGNPLVGATMQAISLGWVFGMLGPLY